jgi:hypothetical protein
LEFIASWWRLFLLWFFLFDIKPCFGFNLVWCVFLSSINVPTGTEKIVMAKVPVAVPPKAVKVHLEAEVSSKGSQDETWVFILSLEGNNMTWPGVIIPVRVCEATNGVNRPWVDFGLKVNEYRRSHIGQVPLVGFVSATNHEERPVPIVHFELAVGSVCSAFGLTRSPKADPEPAMADLALA